MIWSRRSGWCIHCDVVNPRLFELEAAKEMLAELNGIRIWEVENLIGQRIVDFGVTEMEFRLYAASKACLPQCLHSCNCLISQGYYCTHPFAHLLRFISRLGRAIPNLYKVDI
jgi:hypothetical protein